MLNFSRIIFVFVFFFVQLSTNAQTRAEKPIQAQVNFSGLFFKTLGPVLADSEITSLEVNDWVIPGISAGYHFNERFYLGYAFHPNRNFVLEEQWSYSNLSSDLSTNVNHNSGTAHTLESRIFPVDFDLYFSAFATHVTAADFTMQSQPVDNQSFALGEGVYSGNTLATWNAKAVTTIGAGLGVNYVHPTGFSATIGLGIPIIFQDPFYENITISSINDSANFLETDIQAGVNAIENEQFYFPMQIQLSLGWNFSDGSCDCPKF